MSLPHPTPCLSPAVLCDAGLTLVEVTFRSPAAAEAIKAIAAEVPGMVVGAGTVRTRGQSYLAVEVGASFLVAPGLNQAVVAHASALGSLKPQRTSTTGHRSGRRSAGRHKRRR